MNKNILKWGGLGLLMGAVVALSIIFGSEYILNGSVNTNTLVAQQVTYPTVTSCYPQQSSYTVGQTVTWVINVSNPSSSLMDQYYQSILGVSWDRTPGALADSGTYFVTNSLGRSSNLYRGYSFNTAGTHYANFYLTTFDSRPGSDDSPGIPQYDGSLACSPVTITEGVSQLTAPAISSPTNNATLYNPTSVGLYWSAVPGATSYTIEVQCSNCSSTTPVSYGSTTNSFQYDLSSFSYPGNYNFNFKVRAYRISDGTNGPWSNSGFFTLNRQSSATSLSAPQIVNPSNNAVFNGVANVSISWGVVSGASQYEIQIDCGDCSTTPWISRVDAPISGGSTNLYVMQISNNDLGNTNHQLRARVRAGDANYNWSNWSNYDYFTVNNASSSSTTNNVTLSTPLITTPANNATLTNMPRTVNLGWKSVSGATSYQVEIVCDLCGTATGSSTYTGYTYTAPGDNTFHFRVRASANGYYGPWSGYSYFTYNTSNTTGTGTPTSGQTTDNGLCLPFSDVVKNDSYCAAIQYYAGKKILNSSTATFNPHSQINRAEISKIISLIRNYTLLYNEQTGFKDVPAGAWFTPYVNTLWNQGVLKGYSDMTFRPENSITRAELIKIIIKITGYKTDTCSGFTYQDVKQDAWYYPYVCVAKQKGILETDRFGNLNPDMPILRYEAIEMIYKANALTHIL